MTSAAIPAATGINGFPQTDHCYLSMLLFQGVMRFVFRKKVKVILLLQINWEVIYVWELRPGNFVCFLGDDGMMLIVAWGLPV